MNSLKGRIERLERRHEEELDDEMRRLLVALFGTTEIPETALLAILDGEPWEYVEVLARNVS